MKTLIKFELKKLISSSFIFLLFGLIIFSMDERITQALSSQQFILYIFTEHYYITYFMMPVFMLLVYKSLDDDMEYILIRSTTYWNYFKSKLAAYSIFSIIFVVGQVFVAFIISLGLRNDNSLNVEDNLSYELFGYYSQYFNSIEDAILSVCIYMIAGLFIVAISFFTINKLFSKKASVKIIIIAYILMVFGLKIEKLNDLPILFIDNYIIFHRNFTYDSKLFINIFTMIAIFIGICNLNKRNCNKKIKVKNKTKDKIGIDSYYRAILFSRHNKSIMFGVLVLMSFWTFIKGGAYEALHNYLISGFLGHPVNSISIIQFLEMLVINTAPIYIIGVFLERESNDRTLLVNIRFKKGIRWIDSILKNLILFIISYVVLNITILVIIGLILGVPFTGGILRLVSSIFVTKVLDISLQALVLVLVYSLSKNMTLSYLSVLLLNCICFLPFNWCLYLPFGISSLSRFEYIVGVDGLEFIPVIIELGILILLSLMFIRKYGYKKILID